MHQQQLLGQPENESALVDEVPLIITARKVDAFLFKSLGGLGIANADEFAGPVMDQITQLDDPAGIYRLNELQRAGRCFDTKGQNVLAG